MEELEKILTPEDLIYLESISAILSYQFQGEAGRAKIETFLFMKELQDRRPPMGFGPA